METPAFLLLCVLVTCSVRGACGRFSEVDVEGEKKADVGTAAHEHKVQPKCVACKMVLMTVQGYSRPNESKKSLKSKLYAACTQLDYLSKVCKRFVKNHLRELIKGLKANEDAETICINAKACKSTLMLHETFKMRTKPNFI